MANTGQPPEKPTVEIAAPPAWAIEMSQRFGEGINGIHGRLDKQDEVLGKVVNESVETNTRLTRVEVRIDVAERGVAALETRMGNASMRVKQGSEVDLAHEAQLAQEKAAREALAEKVDKLAEGHETLLQETTAQTAILVATAKAVREFVATPTVKILGGVLFGIVSTYLANHYGIVLPK